MAEINVPTQLLCVGADGWDAAAAPPAAAPPVAAPVDIAPTGWQ